MKNLLKPGWLIAALVFVVLLTLKHNYQVYTEIVSDGLFQSETLNMWYSILMMLSFDLGIFMLAVRGNRRASMVFSAFLFALNTYFYSVQISDWNTEFHHLIPGVLFAGMSAYLIFYFSDEFAHEIRKISEKARFSSELESLRSQLSAENLQNVQLRKELKNADFQLLKMEERMARFRKRNSAEKNPQKEAENAENSATLAENLTEKFRGKSRKNIRDAILYREKKLNNGIGNAEKVAVESEIRILEGMIGNN